MHSYAAFEVFCHIMHSWIVLSEFLVHVQEYMYPGVSGGQQQQQQQQYPRQDLEESEGEEQSESEEDTQMQGPMGCVQCMPIHSTCNV